MHLSNGILAACCFGTAGGDGGNDRVVFTHSVKIKHSAGA